MQHTEKKKKTTNKPKLNASLKTRIQLQPVPSATVLLNCPLPLKRELVSPFSFCCEANRLFTKLLRKNFSRSSPHPRSCFHTTKDSQRERDTPKQEAMDLTSPEEIIQLFSLRKGLPAQTVILACASLRSRCLVSAGEQ